MTKSAEYKPSIDSLRAVAVILVMYSHYWDDTSVLGHVGVRLFFVISGYLITGILLRARKTLTEIGLRRTLIVFYARRVLRIFPAYYLMLLLCALLLPEVRASLGWHLAYLSNFTFAFDRTWDPWMLAHLWSLSVEEQFYIFWPVLILLTPERHLMKLLLALVAMAVLFRIAMLPVFPPGEPGRFVLTPAAFDALGAGAILAVLELAGRMTVATRLKLTILGGVGFGLALLSPHTDPFTTFNYVFGDFIDVLPMVAIVAWAGSGSEGPLRRLAENPATRYLGRISYGIYLFHVPVLAVIFTLLDRVSVTYPPHGPVRFFIAGSATVAVAAASWRLVESPLNRLKRHFRYPAAAADTMVGALGPT